MDLQEPVSHFTTSPLPDIFQSSLRSLEKVATLPMASFGISLGLVQRILARGDGSVLKQTSKATLELSQSMFARWKVVLSDELLKTSAEQRYLCSPEVGKSVWSSGSN